MQTSLPANYFTLRLQLRQIEPYRAKSFPRYVCSVLRNHTLYCRYSVLCYHDGLMLLGYFLQNLIDRRIRPWVNKKIVEYIGEEEPSLVDFMCTKVQLFNCLFLLLLSGAKAKGQTKQRITNFTLIYHLTFPKGRCMIFQGRCKKSQGRCITISGQVPTSPTPLLKIRPCNGVIPPVHSNIGQDRHCCDIQGGQLELIELYKESQFSAS